MPEPDQAAAIFADAWALYADAIEILDLGKHRIAAEAAWGATKRATDALILARTGRMPTVGQTSAGIRSLGSQNPEIKALRDRFRETVRDLHGNCFYLGICEPQENIAQIIRMTADYIRDATELAES